MVWGIVGLVVVSALIAWREVPPLLKQQGKKELWVFATLLLLGLGMGIANALEVELPNPIDLIRFVYEPLGKTVRDFLT
ncbi:MAG: hypothetical protein ACXVOI_06330 [Tumebacillaceae bacterium]